MVCSNHPAPGYKISLLVTSANKAEAMWSFFLSVATVQIRAPETVEFQRLALAEMTLEVLKVIGIYDLLFVLYNANRQIIHSTSVWQTR